MRTAGLVRQLKELALDVDRLNDTRADTYRLNTTQLRCMDLLTFHGPMRPTEIAKELALSSGGITSVVDGLVKRGYVVRRWDHPDDRRIVIVIPDLDFDLTAERQLWEEFLQATGHLSNEQLRVILGFLRVSRPIVKGAREEVRKQKLLPTDLG